ncbi:MAG: tetraacyldisaccharide 4'-kinase [Thermodesulfobacteriota bacterium]|nr:tetraacyldisaccharide 4'-kinase [Thermodesulfobacteriota bacterium]
MTHDGGPPPAFSSPFEGILYACSLVYEWAMGLRLYLYRKGIFRQRGLPCKVLSIGNLTVGGTGKTPMVHYVATLLQAAGVEVAVISRGYGGYAQHSGGLVSNGKTTFMGSEASGDEPQLLAEKLSGIPLFVGKDRCRAARRAVREFGPSVLVLDDGFQHLRIKRDLDLLLLDSTRPFGNGHCIPRGTLREPVEQMKRATAIVFTRWAEGSSTTREDATIEAFTKGRPVFKSIHVPEALYLAGNGKAVDLAGLKGRRLFAFSGIGRNESFRKTIGELEGHVAGFCEFPDHHRYSDRDLRSIWKRARDLKVHSIITTEKDFVKISTEIPAPPRLLVLAISISFGADRQRFDSYITDWALSP